MTEILTEGSFFSFSKLPMTVRASLNLTFPVAAFTGARGQLAAVGGGNENLLGAETLAPVNEIGRTWESRLRRIGEITEPSSVRIESASVDAASADRRRSVNKVNGPFYTLEDRTALIEVVNSTAMKQF